MSRKNPNNKWVFTTKRERSHEILGTQGRNGDFFFFFFFEEEEEMEMEMEMEENLQVNPTHIWCCQSVSQSVREKRET